MAQVLVRSPVLVGREDLVALAGRRLREAAQGRGGMLFLAGEAGIGKTRLLETVTGLAEREGFLVATAAAFPGDEESSAGLLLDLASGLDETQPALGDLGRDLGVRLRGNPVAAEDAHRRRRLLVQDMVDALAGDRPDALLVVLEDLHWADDLSLEVLGRLAPRLRHRRLLVAGAYRSDELFPRVPMRALRSRLVAQRLAEEVRLPRLTRKQTTALVGALLDQTPSARLLESIMARSDGIPLHVEELLAAAGSAGQQDAAGHGAVPDTLRDAILARSRRLTPAAQDIARAAAVIGRSFDFDLLVTVTNAEPDHVAAALQELRDSYLVLPGAGQVTFDFRHALIRDALYAEIDLASRRRLHERAATAATERGYRLAAVSAHWELAQRSNLAFATALSAAEEAAALSAHREALELYQRAARNLPPDVVGRKRAAIWAALGDEATASDDNAAAAKAYATAHRLLAEAGDVRGGAVVATKIAAVGHLLGEDLQTRTRTLDNALATLAEEPDADEERALVYSGLAAAYMLARRLDESIAYGERSLALSQRGAGRHAGLDTAATLGAVLVFAGRMAEGWDRLAGAIAQARQEKREPEGARAYRMLGTSASVLVEYDRAERWLDEGISYARATELGNHENYMRAHRAHVRWAVGDWDAAEDEARRVLAEGTGGLTTTITAEYVLGYVALGRGDWATAERHLRDSFAAGERMAELQRLSPPLWGLAEMARCRGDLEMAVRLCEQGFVASAEVGDAAYLFPFLLTGTRAQLAVAGVDAAEDWEARVAEILTLRSIPGTSPALPHARGLLLAARGQPAEAVVEIVAAEAGWEGRRRFWEAAWARLDLAALAARLRRRAEAVRLVEEARQEAEAHRSRPLLAEVDRVAAALVGTAGQAPWFPLSAREFEVARLVANGLTNKQIAERLVLAPKTISAHVEHILAKLGVTRRAEIAAWCAVVVAAMGRSGSPAVRS